MKVVNNYKEANCITHSGTMHADDVFSSAFLDLYIKDIKVYRTNNLENLDISEETFVYDIGRGKFDHHQIDAKRRENDIPYCSFGLLWQEFGKEYLKQLDIEYIDEVFEQVDKDLVEAIDADDNGYFPKIEANYKVKTLSNVIKLFNPGYESYEDEKVQFEKAVNVAKQILEEEIIFINGRVLADKKVSTILETITEEDKYIILDTFLPYEDSVINNPIADNLLFVAFPSNRGGYVIKTLPKSQNDKTARMKFPEEWAGLEGKTIKELTGIKGLNFCHNGRFIINCSDIDTVYEVLDKLCK